MPRPRSPRTSKLYAGDTPALTPTLSADTSTNRVSVSTARSPLTSNVFVKSTSPVTLRPAVGAVPVPMVRPPDIVSPIFRTFSEAAPVRSPLIVPAAKSPLASRRTAVFATLAELKVMLPAFQTMLPLTFSASAFSTRTLREPDPSVELPPVATKPTL